MDLLVLAKEPVPGRVKTRLCPPCTPAEAAAIAEAALADTLAAASAMPAPTGWSWRSTASPGHWCPPGVVVVAAGRRRRSPTAWPRRGAPTAGPALQIGMDTPQVTPRTSTRAMAASSTAPGRRGARPRRATAGWWAHRPPPRRSPASFAGIPTSRADTGARQQRRLRRPRAAHRLRLPTHPRRRHLGRRRARWPTSLRPARFAARPRRAGRWGDAVMAPCCACADGRTIDLDVDRWRAEPDHARGGAARRGWPTRCSTSAAARVVCRGRWPRHGRVVLGIDPAPRAADEASLRGAPCCAVRCSRRCPARAGGGPRCCSTATSASAAIPSPCSGAAASCCAPAAWCSPRWRRPVSAHLAAQRAGRGRCATPGPGSRGRSWAPTHGRRRRVERRPRPGRVRARPATAGSAGRSRP